MKKFVKFLSLCLTTALLLSMTACSYNTDTPDATNDGAITTKVESSAVVKSETVNNNVTSDFAPTMLFTYGATVVNEEQNSVSKTITATVLPEEAPDKSVDWSIEWNVNNEGENAVVTDYVTVTPLEDGSNVATVTAFKSFKGSSMTITCTTRVGLHKATCNVIFDGAPSRIDLSINGANYDENTKAILEIETGFLNGYKKTSHELNFSMINVFGELGEKYNSLNVTYGIRGKFIASQESLTTGSNLFGSNSVVVDLDNKTLSADSDIYSFDYSLENIFNLTKSGENNCLETITSLEDAYSINLVCPIQGIENYQITLDYSLSPIYSLSYLEPYVDENGETSKIEYYITFTEPLSNTSVTLTFDISDNIDISLSDGEIIF